MSLRAELRSCDLFGELDDDALQALESEVHLVEIEGQKTLFEQGDKADGLYHVLQGRLRVSRGGEVIGEVGRGGYVGELALLMDAPRSATVRAVRDGVLLHLSDAGFRQLVNQHPSAAMELARTLARRTYLTHKSSSREGIRTVAVVPMNPRILPDIFIEAFGRLGRVAAVRREDAPASEYLSQLEQSRDIVVYLGQADDPEWTRRCLRQADAILLLASADEPAHAPPAEIGQLDIPTDLVLLRTGDGLPSGTAKWLDLGSYRNHHHVRRNSPADAARVARLLCGRATGIALSGGASRTTAYIGVFKALRECGIEIDLIAGTSGGAMLGAMQALGCGPDDMLDKIRAMGRAPFYRDLGPPLVSMLGGGVINRLLQSYYGDTDVEDTPIALLPVCASLPHSKMVVASRGPLWRAVRASMAVPGIFPPMPWNGDLLVDGGIVNNLPTDLLFSTCVQGKMIAADVGASPQFAPTPDELEGAGGWSMLWRRWTGRPRLPSLLDILMQSACLASNARLQQSLQNVHLHIQPLAQGPAALKDPLAAMVEAGYRETMAALAATTT
jgi:NTE family protein